MKKMLYCLCVVALVSGCEKKKCDMSMMMEKPEPASEMAKLEPLVGSWDDTMHMVSPAPDDMAQAMPDGEDKMPDHFKGSWECGWTLDNMYLKCEGWHDAGEDSKMHYVEYYRWDDKIDKFRTVSFSNWGGQGEGTIEVSPCGNIFRLKGKQVSPDGTKKHFEGEMVVINADTVRWEMEMEEPFGSEMEFEGTSTRKQ